VAAHGASRGVLLVRTLGGAFGRVPTDATAFAYRDGEVFVMMATFLPPGADPSGASAFDAAWEELMPHTNGMYGNFSPATSDEITELMYPPATLERLREAKRVWDPGNLFAHNHNVAP